MLRSELVTTTKQQVTAAQLPAKRFEEKKNRPPTLFLCFPSLHSLKGLFPPPKKRLLYTFSVSSQASSLATTINYSDLSRSHLSRCSVNVPSPDDASQAGDARRSGSGSSFLFLLNYKKRKKGVLRDGSELTCCGLRATGGDRSSWEMSSWTARDGRAGVEFAA